MPTARELLEQADALMRRNRDAGAEDVPVLTDIVPPAVDLEDDVPVLTAVVPDRPATQKPDWQEEDSSGIDIDADLAAMGPEFPASEPSALAKPVDFVSLRADVRVPMLEIPKETHQYRLDPVSAGVQTPGAKTSPGISGEILERTLPLSELLNAPNKTVEAQFLDVPPGAALSPVQATAAEVAGPAPAAAQSSPAEVPSPPQVTEPPKVVDLSAQVAELTEQITLQVLQKLDIYTERGLQDHLSQHLRPVVERAVGDLVATINSNVGRVIRTFVAESIEREIESFRKEIAETVKRAQE